MKGITIIVMSYIMFVVQKHNGFDIKLKFVKYEISQNTDLLLDQVKMGGWGHPKSAKFSLWFLNC